METLKKVMVFIVIFSLICGMAYLSFQLIQNNGIRKYEFKIEKDNKDYFHMLI